MLNRSTYCIVLFVLASGATAVAASVKSNAFDHDPGWEGFNNRTKPQKPTIITQDFGYSKTNFAGKRAGEAGGAVQRSMTPAFYADRLESPVSLEDRITCSGTFAVTASDGSGGIFFGFFNDQKVGASSRPTNSLGMSLDFQGTGGRMAVYLITSNNKVHGNFITPYIPGTYRPTPIKNDASVRYTWKLDYDPSANDGNGRFTFTIKGDGDRPANFEGKRWVVDIPKELRQDGATFTHFGMMNLLVDGGKASMYFDDLSYNGKTEDFSTDPGWEGSNNRGTFEEREPHGAQNFGHADTNLAGGMKPGEIGGIFWRDARGGYYADRVGPLSLEDRLEARGRIILAIGATDADMRFGWFNSTTQNPTPQPTCEHFLGIKIGGPTRVGHYFLPEVITAKGTHSIAQGTRENPKAGPIMIQKKAYDWSLVYDPLANGGNGSIRATLGDESVVLDLKPGVKTEGATFDRFGMLAIPVGGHHVKVFIDDIEYTAAPATR
jgi:hypothetical protein